MFKPGSSGNISGRKKGIQNKVTQFKASLLNCCYTANKIK